MKCNQSESSKGAPPNIYKNAAMDQGCAAICKSDVPSLAAELKTGSQHIRLNRVVYEKASNHSD